MIFPACIKFPSHTGPHVRLAVSQGGQLLAFYRKCDGPGAEPDSDLGEIHCEETAAQRANSNTFIGETNPGWCALAALAARPLQPLHAS